jgi:hypothetical protein
MQMSLMKRGYMVFLEIYIAWVLQALWFAIMMAKRYCAEHFCGGLLDKFNIFVLSYDVRISSIPPYGRKEIYRISYIVDFLSHYSGVKSMIDVSCLMCVGHPSG